MIPEQTLVQFPDFADNGTKIKPEDEKYAAGFVPSDVLPAQWLNYFFNKASAGQTVINAGLASIEAELNNLLTEAGITPAAATNDQIKTAIYTMIQNKTGVLSQLTTTAKNNLVAALNEVKAGLGAAAAKGVDTEITSESSTNLPTTQAVSNQLNGALTDYGNRKKTITLSQKSITTSWGNIATYTVEKTSSLLFQLSMVVGGRNMWTAINIIQKRNETTINQYIKEVYLHNDYGDRITTDWLFNNVQIGDEIIIACACVGSSYIMNSGVIELKYF